MANDRFSKRHGFKAQEAEITVRQDAPHGLREFVVQAVISLGYDPEFVRKTQGSGVIYSD